MPNYGIRVFLLFFLSYFTDLLIFFVFIVAVGSTLSLYSYMYTLLDYWPNAQLSHYLA